MAKLKLCSKCVTPETHETILFDAQGACNICQNNEVKQTRVDWGKKKTELDELVAAHRGKYDYDCLVPFSGAKDSTWTLYYLMKEYGLKPLVVRFDHGFLRPNLVENTTRTLRRLGADFLQFTPNWKVVRQLMLQSLLDKGDFCWHCHTGIFAYSMWIALEKNVPLIFWGEPSAEYTAYYSYDQPEEVDEKRFNRIINLGISADDMFVRLGGKIDKRDLKPFTYPPLKELRRIRYRSVCLGSYVPWDVKKQVAIIKHELGWKGDQVEGTPPGYDYEKIECHMQGVRDYIKYIKRGYSRTSHLTSIDIRNHRLTREEALEMVKKYEGKRPPSLDVFLEILGLTEAEFYEIALTHQVAPHQFDPRAVLAGDPTPDYSQWTREGALPRAETRERLEQWREQHAPQDTRKAK